MNEKLLNIIALSQKYCACVENASESEKSEFVDEILVLLSGLYCRFLEYDASEDSVLPDYGYFQSYVDEEFYNSVRQRVSMLFGEDDIFLETFEQDMKYSDSPIAASISESIADIFQPLYDFIMIVRESDGDQALMAYGECREKFKEYWSQTLCNVLRPLNNLKFNII